MRRNKRGAPKTLPARKKRAAREPGRPLRLTRTAVTWSDPDGSRRSADQLPLVTTVTHAPFFTWYIVDEPCFSAPVLSNAMWPVTPSKLMFLSAAR